jgi:hypothetical protein
MKRRVIAAAAVCHAPASGHSQQVGALRRLRQLQDVRALKAVLGDEVCQHCGKSGVRKAAAKAAERDGVEKAAGVIEVGHALPLHLCHRTSLRVRALALGAGPHDCARNLQDLL